MSELRRFFDVARPLGAPDPVMALRRGEGLSDAKPRKIGPTTVIVDVSARLPDGGDVPLSFLVSEQNFYRRRGAIDLLRPGHYRHVRDVALDSAIQKASGLRRLLPPPGRVDYNRFSTQSARVEDIRVGPFGDPESLVVFVELLTGAGIKVVALGKGEKKRSGPGKYKKSRVEIVASDEGVSLDEKLTSALEIVALKELRRLGVSV